MNKQVQEEVFVRLSSIHTEVYESSYYYERPVEAKTVGQKIKRLMGEHLGSTGHYAPSGDWHKLHVNGEPVAWIGKGLLSQVNALQLALAKGSQVEVCVETETRRTRRHGYQSNRKYTFVKEIKIRNHAEENPDT